MPNITGVEIFAEGRWNGNEIDDKTLASIVEAYQATKEFFQPVLKLGHDDEQDILKKEGLPSAGWVSSLYVKGSKLLADFSDIPQKIYDLIKKKAYRKVSVEIFKGYTFKEKVYDNLLGAVALLGADTPAVLTLNDILSRYGLDGQKFAIDNKSSTIDVKIYTTDLNKGDSMPEEDTKADVKLQKLQSDIAELRSLVDKISGEKKTVEESFSSYKKDTDSKITSLQESKNKAEIEIFTLALQNKRLVSPSMLPLIEALTLNAKETYSVGDKKLSGQALIEELLTLAKTCYAVNTKESTSDEKPETKTKDEKIEVEIEKYLKDHPKISYAEAYKEVSRELRGN